MMLERMLTSLEDIDREVMTNCAGLRSLVLDATLRAHPLAIWTVTCLGVTTTGVFEDQPA